MIWEASQISLFVTVIIHTIVIVCLAKGIKQRFISSMGIPPGMQLPKLTVRTQEGKVERLQSLMEQVPNTMLCVVHENCRFCKEILPELDRVTKLYPELFTRLLVVTDADCTLETFQVKTQTSLPLYGIQESDVLGQLKISTYPFGVLVDREGVILRRELMRKSTLLTWLIDVPQYVRFNSEGKGEAV